MDEIVISKEELIDLFEKEILKDTNKGWTYNDEVVDIIALHEIDPKYLQDITNAKFYKIKLKNKK